MMTGRSRDVFINGIVLACVFHIQRICNKEYIGIFDL